VLFRSLDEDDLVKVAALLVEEMNARLAPRGLSVELREDAARWLVARTAGQREYGARPLRRAIERHVADPLADAVLRGAITPGGSIVVGVRDASLWYWRGEEGAPLAPAMDLSPEVC
jgi:ATP-dependent Clp protease ATP-binding subunit ClpA